jgi:outer membrane protein assembly factor BamB
MSHPAFWRGTFTVTLALISAGSALASDWPQWRGPNRDDLSTETGLLKSWPAGGPPLAWKATSLGGGYAGVAVAKGRVFTMGDANQASRLMALDESSGKELWTARIGAAATVGGHDGPRGTPTVDGELVYALNQTGDLLCAETATGKEVWRKSLTADFGGRPHMWGYAESPLVDGDKVFCTPGGGRGAIVALNQKTGQLVWQSKEFTDAALYSSLIAADIFGQRQVIQLTGSSVAGVAVAEGKLLWRADRRGQRAVIPTPIYQDAQVFVTSGYETGCNLFKLSKDGEAITATQVYSNKELVNQHGGAILLNGHVYGHSDSGGWVCLDLKTGRAAWKNPGVGKGSIAYADGHLYLRSESGRDGGSCLIALIEATPEGYKEKSRFEQPERSRRNSWAHPVIANGKLYLRDQRVLLCYDIKAKSA